jgi:hypothetical protein
MRRDRLAGALLAVVVCAGCGSTVRVSGSAATPGPDAALDVPAQTGTADPTVSVAGGAGPTSGPGRTSVRGGAAAPSPGATTHTSTALPVSGRGYDARNVYIGIPTQKDANSGAAALGLVGLDFGDQEGQARAVIAAVNKDGGVLGRRVVPVFHDIASADVQSDPQHAAQAACTALTEDRQVAGVVNLVAGIDVPTFYGCLKQHDTPVVSGGLLPTDTAFQRQFAPYFYSLFAPSYDDVMGVLLDRLKARDYFTGWDTTGGRAGAVPVRLGLIYAQQGPENRIGKRLKTELVRRGYTVAADWAYDSSTTASSTRDVAAAVLPFRSANVTHVVALDSLVVYFELAAQQQQYRPRYAYTSYSAAGVLLQANAAGQQPGSLGVGWAPTTDTDSAHDPGVLPGETACRKAMREGGQDVSARSTELVAMELCDGINMLVLGARSGGGFDAAALRAGLSSIGQAFRPALSFGSALGPGSAYLPGGARDFGWSASCSCFVYLDNRNHAIGSAHG